MCNFEKLVHVGLGVSQERDDAVARVAPSLPNRLLQYHTQGEEEKREGWYRIGKTAYINVLLEQL